MTINELKLHDKLKADKRLTKNQVAYLMATTAHETGYTFLPISEKGSDNYLMKYWTNSKLRRWLGNIVANDAVKYKGRGFVQITGRSNYTTASKILGVDMITRPELANDYDNAYEILVHFTIKGLFTGVALSRYINAKDCDFYNARRVINGLDKAYNIELLAVKYARLP
jgi:predicted chitinase